MIFRYYPLIFFTPIFEIKVHEKNPMNFMFRIMRQNNSEQADDNKDLQQKNLLDSLDEISLIITDEVLYEDIFLSNRLFWSLSFHR